MEPFSALSELVLGDRGPGNLTATKTVLSSGFQGLAFQIWRMKSMHGLQRVRSESFYRVIAGDVRGIVDRERREWSRGEALELRTTELLVWGLFKGFMWKQS